MSKTYRRSADESEYFREQKLRREMEKRANRKQRYVVDEEDTEDTTTMKRRR